MKEELKKAFKNHMLGCCGGDGCPFYDFHAEGMEIKNHDEAIDIFLELELRKIANKIEGMGFVKENSDITQEYQSTFLDGYNQAIEEVVEMFNSSNK